MTGAGTSVEEAHREGSSEDAGRALHRKLVVIYLQASIAATLSGALFFLFGLDFSTYQMMLVLGLMAPLAMLPQLVTELFLIRRHVAPIRAFFEAEPESRSPALAARALTRALNLPLLTAARVLFVHAPILSVFLTALCLLANRYLSLGLLGWQFAMVYVTIVVFASGHAIYEYLAVKSAARDVLPIVRARVDEASRDDLPSVRPLRMRSQLSFVFAFVACVPLAALGFTAMLKLDRMLSMLAVPEAAMIERSIEIWVALMVVGGSFVALLLATMLSRDIASSAERLAEAMRRVERGDVNAELVIGSTDEFAEAFRGFNRMTRGLAERERLRDAFGRYVAPELADEVMKHGVSMGGSLVRATVIFIDIRGFTSLSERMPAVEVVSLLNRYFAAVSPPILAEGGFINKFGGDSLLAVFGAPVPEEDHARHAARAALGVRAALSSFNEREVSEGRTALRVGIGVHTGEMVAGSVGSPERMEYTVIGDVVNVAARIEALNKDFGTDVLLSSEAYEAVKDEVRARPMEPVVVRGKAEPLVVYAVG